MIFHYTLTKDKLKRMLFKKQQKTNYIYLILYSILYFYLCYRSLFEDVLITIMIYLIGLLLLWVVLIILNCVYTFLLIKINERRSHNLYGRHVIRVENDQLVETVEDKILIIKKEEIKK